MSRILLAGSMLILHGVVAGQADTAVRRGLGLDLESIAPPSLFGAPAVPPGPTQQYTSRRTCDLRYRLPTPADQGTASTCLFWSVIYSVLSYYDNTERQQRSMEKLRLTYEPGMLRSPQHAYRQYYLETKDCPQRGTHYDRLWPVLRNRNIGNGWTPAEVFVCSDKPNPDLQSQVGGGFTRLFNKEDNNTVVTDQDIAFMKHKLSNGDPVLIGLGVDGSFWDQGHATSGNAPVFQYVPGSGPVQGHAVVLVGYDALGNFIFLNSYGTGWGESGYFRMSREAFKGSLICAYTYEPFSPFKAPSRASISENLLVDQPRSFWVKRGWKNTFNGMDISPIDLGRKYALLQIREPVSELDARFFLNTGQTAEFTHQDLTYTVRLDRVGLKGWLFWKRAMFYTITAKEIHVEEPVPYMPVTYVDAPSRYDGLIGFWTGPLIYLDSSNSTRVQTYQFKGFIDPSHVQVSVREDGFSGSEALQTFTCHGDGFMSYSDGVNAARASFRKTSDSLVVTLLRNDVAYATLKLKSQAEELERIDHPLLACRDSVLENIDIPPNGRIFGMNCVRPELAGKKIRVALDANVFAEYPEGGRFAALLLLTLPDGTTHELRPAGSDPVKVSYVKDFVVPANGVIDLGLQLDHAWGKGDPIPLNIRKGSYLVTQLVQ